MFSRDCEFSLTDEEYEKLKEWYNENFKGRYFGAIGGALEITFNPTSIGQIITVRCMDKEITLREL